MAWFSFIDNSYNRQPQMPYSVLSGILIEDTHVWSLAREIKDAQLTYMNAAVLNNHGPKLKADALLNPQNFRDAGLLVGTELVEVSTAGTQIQNRRRFDFTETGAAAASARISYCKHILSLAHAYNASAIAMLSPLSADLDQDQHSLTRSYDYLIERFGNFLSGIDDRSVGILALLRGDYEQAALKLRELESNLINSSKTRAGVRRVVPEPVCVNDQLGAVCHLGEVFSYIVGWGTRLPGMVERRRPELSSLLRYCSAMRFSYLAENGKKDWSFKFVPGV